MSVLMQIRKPDRKEYFIEQYNQHFSYVYAYIFARTAGNRQLTETVVQETFSAAWQSLNQYKEKCSFATWLCAIAKNKLMEEYRKIIHQKKHECADCENITEYKSSSDPEQFVLEREKYRCVQNVLNELTPLYRYVLIMKYMDGMSVKEIAKSIGKSDRAIDGILQRAKGSFREKYIQAERGEEYG